MLILCDVLLIEEAYHQGYTDLLKVYIVLNLKQI